MKTGEVPNAEQTAVIYVCAEPVMREFEEYVMKEGYSMHVLVQHEYADVLGPAEPITFESLGRCQPTAKFIYEGIVWHHPDGRMAKIKVRDFPKADA